MYIYVLLGVVTVVLAVLLLWEADRNRQEEGEGDQWDSR